MDKQSQIGGKENTQIGGNLTIVNQGLTYSDVKEIINDVTYDLLKNNFPKLQSDAIATAERNVAEFLEKLDTKIRLSTGLLDINRFSDPDIQYSLNDAIQASARKGSFINSNILCEMVVEKILNDKRDLKSITAEEAIRVLPRLSGAHIKFLTFVFAMNSVSIPVESIGDIDKFYKNILDLTDKSYSISESNKKHLEYIGTLSIDMLIISDVRQRIIRTYRNIKDLDKQIETKCPELYKCIEAFQANNLFKIRLTSVGEMIALSNLKQIVNVDYSIWIK